MLKLWLDVVLSVIPVLERIIVLREGHQQLIKFALFLDMEVGRVPRQLMVVYQSRIIQIDM